jgi:carbonic anhydrase
MPIFVALTLKRKLFMASSIDQILAFNREYVASKAYEAHLTDKYPEKKVAVLSCMDTRLSVLLQEALGLRNGDAKIIKNAGAVIPSPWDSAMRSLLVAVYELGVEEIMVIAHTTCGACHMSFSHFREEMLHRGIPAAALERDDIDLHAWLEGFHDTEASVRNTVATVTTHPLIPSDITVRGFIIDSVTGELTEVQ